MRRISIGLHDHLTARDFFSFLSPLCNRTYDAIGCLVMLTLLLLVVFQDALGSNAE